MLTDIFANRYLDVVLWESFDEKARRLLVQGFRIVGEQLFPYYDNEKESPTAKATWDGLNKQLAMELGLNNLSPLSNSYAAKMFGGQSYTHVNTHTKITVCENFVCAQYDVSVPADQFIKERLSFIEIAFRKRGEQVNLINSNLEANILEARIIDKKQQKFSQDYKKLIEAATKRKLVIAEQKVLDFAQNAAEKFQESCDELNARLRQAGLPLDYHNGFIQISSDETVLDTIERPFWNLVADPMWKNVDHDMKEAIDLRDSSGRDPAWFAAKALESTIKIISNEKSWTQGNEKGAASYLSNLQAKKNGEFINKWEHDSLVKFFSSVRNPLGHGAGSNEMPKLSVPQTDWAIEFCMTWIKNLIRRM